MAEDWFRYKGMESFHLMIREDGGLSRCGLVRPRMRLYEEWDEKMPILHKCKQCRGVQKRGKNSPRANELRARRSAESNAKRKKEKFAKQLAAMNAKKKRGQ